MIPLGEAVSEQTQGTSLIWIEFPDEPILTCSFLEIFIFSAILISKVLSLALDMFEFIALSARFVIFPLKDLFEIIVFGMIYAGQIITNAFIITLDFIVNYSNSFCPSIFKALNDISGTFL